MGDFENEIEPALLLSMYAQEELGVKIETEENQNDPPDHFATVENSQKVNLELTQLAGYTIHEKNSFLKQIETEIQRCFEAHKKNLSGGRYLVTYEIGETVLKNGWKFTEVDSNNKISKSNLGQQINSSIKKIISEFKNQSRSNEIKNKDGDQIGIIHLTLKNEANQPEIYVFPQELSVSHTKPSYIYDNIQDIIDTKEKKYTKKYSNSENEWWLLIHDLKNYLNVDLFTDNIDEHLFDFSFFSKVLLIRPGFPGYKISDLSKSNING